MLKRTLETYVCFSNQMEIFWTICKIHQTNFHYMAVGNKKHSRSNFFLMNSDPCTLYSVQCLVYSLQCTVLSVPYKVFSIQCTLHSVQCKKYSAQYMVYGAPLTVYSVESAVYSVCLKVYSVQYSMFRVIWQMSYNDIIAGITSHYTVITLFLPQSHALVQYLNRIDRVTRVVTP